jgi:NAD(P)H dehydrogenase (quinone)
VVRSNRQTERDIQSSGLSWVIGRNGIYIEPDLEYLDTYIKQGGISNCAGDGKCAYTSRPELARAYAKMLLEERHNGQMYNLVGEAITQQRLAELINRVYHTDLSYTPVSVAAYTEDRKSELGDFLGAIVAGIYEGIQRGANDVASDYERATGRPHRSPLKMLESFAAG